MLHVCESYISIANIHMKLTCTQFWEVWFLILSKCGCKRKLWFLGVPIFYRAIGIAASLGWVFQSYQLAVSHWTQAGSVTNDKQLTICRREKVRCLIQSLPITSQQQSIAREHMPFSWSLFLQMMNFCIDDTLGWTL